MGIYKACDIRGIYGLDLNPQEAEQIGRAFGSFLQGGRIAVGGDVRLSTEILKKALVRGLVASGSYVIDLNILPTPLLYFAIKYFNAEGGVMVTASHNPPQYNGFKLCQGYLTITEGDLQKIKALVASGDRMLKVASGSIGKRDVIPSYIQFIKGRFTSKRKLKVVIDAGNGVCGPLAPRIFRSLGCEVIELYCEPDGTFPHHLPDPSLSKNLQDLKEKVLAEGADLGIAYDGDGDRVGFVDEKGGILTNEQVLVLFAKDLLKREGEKVIYDVKCSLVVAEEIKRIGGLPLMERSGHGFIKRRLLEEKALLAGESSGHFFFPELGYDDGIYASLLMVKIVSQNNKKLSDLVSQIPKYPTTSEVRIPCSEEKKREVIERLKGKFASYEFDLLDGIRIKFTDGWGLVRPSITEPVLSIKIEAKTEEKLRELINLFASELPQIKNLF